MKSLQPAPLLNSVVRPPEGAPMFCERCAPLTRTLAFDPAAEPRAELMSGSCMWADELHRDWCIKCIWKTREVFHLRYQMTVGEPVPPESVAYFRELEQQFPNWPLFRPERRSPEIAERVRRMVRRNTRQACIDLERLDREFRRQQAEGQASEAESPVRPPEEFAVIPLIPIRDRTVKSNLR